MASGTSDRSASSGHWGTTPCTHCAQPTTNRTRRSHAHIATSRRPPAGLETAPRPRPRHDRSPLDPAYPAPVNRCVARARASLTIVPGTIAVAVSRGGPLSGYPSVIEPRLVVLWTVTRNEHPSPGGWLRGICGIGRLGPFGRISTMDHYRTLDT